MRFDTVAKLLEVMFAFRQCPMRIDEQDFTETNAVAGAQLRRDSKIDSDHVGDFRVTANGLSIVEQKNRFTARRHLDRSRRYRFRQKIDIAAPLERPTIEPDAHPV